MTRSSRRASPLIQHGRHGERRNWPTSTPSGLILGGTHYATKDSNQVTNNQRFETSKNPGVLCGGSWSPWERPSSPHGTVTATFNDVFPVQSRSHTHTGISSDCKMQLNLLQSLTLHACKRRPKHRSVLKVYVCMYEGVCISDWGGKYQATKAGPKQPKTKNRNITDEKTKTVSF
jgi:hypothetical protein